jgi:hypothetical protein
MKIPLERIQQVTKKYAPAYRWLYDADYEFPKASGRFLVNQGAYYTKPLEHATDVEIQLCLNQLSYVAVGEAIRNGNPEMFKGLDYDALQKEGMLIIESRKRFRRAIDTSRTIGGELNLLDLRDTGKIILANTTFQFENKSCFGELELVIVKSPVQGGKQ